MPPPRPATPFTSASFPLAALGIARHLAPPQLEKRDNRTDVHYEGLQGQSCLPAGLDVRAFCHGFDENFFFAWPPNLFAFTSLFFETTGSYALVTSPEMLSPENDSLAFPTSSAGLPSEREKKGDQERLKWAEEMERDAQASTQSILGEFLSPRWQTYVGDAANRWRTSLYDLVVRRSNLPHLLGLIPDIRPQTGASVLTEGVQPETLYLDLTQALHPHEPVEKASTIPFLHDGGPSEKFREGLKALGVSFPPHLREVWDVVRAAMDLPGVGNANDIWKLQELASPDREGSATDRWTNRSIFKCLWTLHAVADTACLGWGLRNLQLLSKHPIDAEKSRLVHNFIQRLLHHTGNLSFVSPTRCRVLPKRHTPQVGTSLRACSSSLAFYRSSIQVDWRTDAVQVLRAPGLGEPQRSSNPVAEPSQEPAMQGAATQSEDQESKRATPAFGQVNVLVLPWPLRVRASDFKSENPLIFHGQARSSARQREAQLHFRYSPTGEARAEMAELIKKKLPAVLSEAQNEASHVDMVVLPEYALPSDLLLEFECALHKAGVKSYVAGITKVGVEPSERAARDASGMGEPGVMQVPQNCVRVGYLLQNESPAKDPCESHEACRCESTGNRHFHHAIYTKHHRWKLDSFQIKGYQLGGTLAPGKEHWEYISVRGPRKAVFVNFGEQLTLCPIICEDLARQESLADLIRSVGPSLIVTVLMDGPQTRERWASKYASVFGDDPGCGVLAVTSMGMVDRWRGTKGERSRAIGLWAQRNSRTEEIFLEEGAHGVLLGLAVDVDKERTIDSRVENVDTFGLSLGGKTSIRIPG